MKAEKLGNLFKITSGGTPSRNKLEFFANGDIPWVKTGDLGKKYVTEPLEKISQLGLENSSAKIFPPRTVLVAMYGATIGSCSILRFEACTNQACAAFLPNEKVDHEYLYYFLRSFKQQLVALGQGGGQPNISGTLLKSVKIPLPPLDDQKRIAHLLGKVEGLIARRKQHLQQLDDLLKSVFLEMFAPQAPGYPDWPLVEIKDLAAKHKGAMRTGPFGSNLLHSEFTAEGDVAVLGIDNAVQNCFVWGERRFITNEKYRELESYRIYPGDVIVTIMGTIGRSSVIPDDIPLAINTKHLAAITLNNEIANPLFVSYSIHSSPFILNQLKSKNRGAIMSGLNLGLIKETKLKRPPIALQDQFGAIHKKIDEIKSRYQQSLTDLEHLYGALSQKAFKGELDLSRVVLPLGKEGPAEAMEPITTEFPDTQPVIELPAPDSVASFVTAEGRKALIGQWLEVYLELLGSMPFSAQYFMETAQQRLAELLEELQEPESLVTDYKFFQFGLNEYDHVKELIFQALESGRLAQAYDEAGNRVQLTMAKG